MRIFVFVFLFFSLFSIGFSAEWFVNATAVSTCNPSAGATNNRATIQAAVDAAASGDTIYICDNSTGAHFANAEINKASLKIFGKTAGVIVNASSATLAVLNVSATGVEITNLTVQGANSASSANAIGIKVIANSVNIYNVSVQNNRYGIYLNGASSGTVTNNTVNQQITYGIILDATSNTNTVSNNIASNATYGILVLSSGSNTISGNLALNNSVDGISLQSTSNSNTLTSNTARLNLQAGVSVIDSSSNTVNSNTAHNNIQDGFLLNNGDSNTLSSNVAHNNTAYGFLLITNSNGNSLNSNTANQNQQSGFGLQSNSAQNNLTSNTANSNTFYGFYLTAATSNNITASTTNSNLRGFFLESGSNSNNVSNNNAGSNTQYGYHVIDSNSVSMHNNNATSSTLVQYVFASGSNITFTNNAALTTGTSAWDLHINTSSNVTTKVGSRFYNFTTSDLRIAFDAATDVNLKTLTASAAGVSDSCADSNAYSTCNLVPYSGAKNVVNITSTSANAAISLGVYYDAASLGNLGAYIARYSSGWIRLDADESSSGFVVDNNIRTFSIFGAVGFESRPTSDAPGAKSLSINFDLSTTAVCPANKIKIKAESAGDGVGDVLVRLLKDSVELQSIKTNASGDVEFLLTSSGAYALDAQKTGYAKPDIKEFNYTMCEEATAPVNITNVTVPTPQPVPTPTPSENVTVPTPVPTPTPPPPGKKTEENVTVEPDEVEKKGEAPSADNTYLYATLLIIIVALIVYYYLSRKKEKRRK